MEMPNNPVKHEVRIKQNLRSILDISVIALNHWSFVICNNLQQSHCTCTPSFLRNKLLERKVFSKDNVLAKNTARAQILDADF